jgi:hypothetical protein
MASLLDLSLINYFSNIFVILFVFAASYAILTFRGPFGNNKGVNALLSATMALIFIFSQDAINVIKDSVPWFIVMMVMLMFVFLVSSSIGAPMDPTIMKNISTYVLIIGVLVLVINISQKVGQNVGPYLSNETTNTNVIPATGTGDVASGSYSQNFGATLFHPKVLALMLIVVISVFSVLWIGYVGI